MRLFVAIPIPAEIRKRIWAAAEPFEERGIKLVEMENYHITLQFIGEFKDVHKVISALRRVPFEPIEVKIAGSGGFPTKERPRVIWIGAENEQGKLRELTEAVGKALDEEGIPHDEKPFHGHVTVARVKKPVKELMEAVHRDFGQFRADFFALYQSTLTPEGPIYREIARFGEGR